MSALLALQLAGTSLPAEIAQEAGVDAGRGESPAEVAKEQEAAAEEKASPTQRGQGTSPQPDGTTDDTPNEVDKKENTPSQTDQAAAAEADADEPAVAEAEKDAIASAEAVALTAASEDDAVVFTAQDAQNAVTYIDESGQPATRDQYTLIDAEPEGDATITLANGWYVVQSQVVATKRVEIQGHAHLILCDGANLIAQKGVHNAKGSTLSVYGQAEHTGELRATGEDTAHSAGIGGNEGEKAGTFNAYGARTVAQGGEYAAGIGGGFKNDGGTVLVRGKNTAVTANGGNRGAGIGGGQSGDGAEVTIGGGATVTATGGEGGAGIGGGLRAYGLGGAGRKVTIDGGTVTAQAGEPIGGSAAQAIGHGSGSDASGTIGLYDVAKVLHGAQAGGAGAAISTAAQRVPSCRDLWAQIGPCEHKDAGGDSTATLRPTADRLHHVEGCTQCLYVRSDQSGKPIEHDHDFGTTSECACGAHAHRVSFDKNADRATGTMAASDYVVEQAPYTLPACGFAREGYAFAGWDTQAQGGGDAYADRATLTMGEADVTLFAQWRPTRFGGVTGVAASYVYTGRPHEPRPTVTGPEGQPLREGADYRLEYEDNVSATSGGRKAKVRMVGTGEYAGVAAEVEFAIAKSTPAAPAAPRLRSATATSISVHGEPGCEYSADGGRTWRALGADGTVTFPGLRPATAHSVVGRVRATANTNASAASAALSISTESPRASASYRAHVQNLGWRAAARDGAVGGTTGRALRLEALSLGVAANMGGGVSCRAHVANRGWLGWARGGVAGTVGQGRRAEAIRVVLVRRDAKAPSARYGGAAQSFPRPYRRGGPSAR